MCIEAGPIDLQLTRRRRIQRHRKEKNSCRHSKSKLRCWYAPRQLGTLPVNNLQKTTLDCHASSVYPELRRVAGGMMRTRGMWTLSPTALVHEAFIKLARSGAANWQDDRHFVSACAQAMRHLMVDRARQKLTNTHGGHMARVPLTDVLLGCLYTERLVAVNDAIDALDVVDNRQAEIVKLRFFAGLTTQEVAGLLGVSRRTVQTEWRMAKAWLHRELHDEPKQRPTPESE